MSLQEEVDLLRRIPVFAKIEPSKLKLLAFTSERLTYAADDIVFKQGDPGDAAYIIIRGSADVIVETPKGPLIVTTLKDNDFVGEIAILCDVSTHRNNTGEDRVGGTVYFKGFVLPTRPGVSGDGHRNHARTR